jgi:hypothetical protein
MNGGATTGGAMNGGATTGGTTTNGGTDAGGTASGGTMMDGGRSTGGTATGGRATGGTTTGGMGGQGDGGAGRSNGGTSGTGAAGRGGAGSGGANAGAGGMPSGCEDAISCTVCCDELFPDGHLDFAGRFFNCGCGNPCATYCFDLCSTTYNWSSDCLACLLQVPMSNADCVTASNSCGENATCRTYRACLLSCR